MGFIVGLNRDRDSYHVPAAVAEAGELDRFVTDYYVGRWVDLPTLSHRKHEVIPREKVTPSLGAFARQVPYEVKRRFGAAYFPTYPVERRLGATIARVASRLPESDLLLYSGSAVQAFEGPSRGRRILFQYHPSPDFIARTMEGLDELETLRPWRRQDEVVDQRMTRDHHREIGSADRALCASSFTARGLADAGMAPEATHVVPYGCPTPSSEAPPVLAQPTFLFCGQGSQRKGLHILIEAWRSAEVGNASLCVVSSAMDPEIRDMVEATPGVTLRSGLTRAELDRVMLEADTFVLPSLLEGFGLVIGEALANGCRIIATSNTGLVDLALPERIGSVITPGRVQPLIEALEANVATYDPTRPYHAAAIEAARRRSWSAFRAGVREAVGL